MSSLRARRIARNPFAFPGGNPGFNPAHPLANKLRFSAVPNGNNFFTIAGQKPGCAGTVSGSPTAFIDGRIGQCVKYTASGTAACAYFNNNYSTNTPVGFTAAGIYVPNTSEGVSQFIVTSSQTGASTNVQGLLWNGAGSSKWGMSLGNSVVTSASTSPNVVVGVPYFVVVSVLGGTGYNLVFVRLDTGQIYTEVVAAATALIAWQSGVNVGNQNGGNGTRAASGNIAATMMSENYFTMPQLVQIASDPWSFWFPQA